MSDRLLRESDVIKALNVSIYKDDIEDAINAIPSADIPQWIPCSERLPELGQKVLVSTKKTVFTQVFKGYYSDPKRWAWEHNSVKTIEAWMPLPTEYKGANDE